MIGNFAFTVRAHKSTRLACQRVPRVEGAEGDRKAPRLGSSLLEPFEDDEPK
jgi:hypothetical protein